MHQNENAQRKDYQERAKKEPGVEVQIASDDVEPLAHEPLLYLHIKSAATK
jgi:hypothetical protein